jgi:hypothetical protein
VLSPDVLAHGHLVTTDLGLSLFFFLSVVAFERLSERATQRMLVLAGLALGAAFATKFSAPILLPVLVVLATVAVVAPQPMASALSGPARTIESRAMRVKHAAMMLAGMGLIAFAVLWASYGFRGPISPDPVVRAACRAPLAEPGLGLLAAGAARAADVGLLPEDYVRGLLFVLANSEARSTFLLGQLRDLPSPYFFPVTFALKTPVPLIVLLVLAAFATPRLSGRTAAFLWVPVVLYLAFTFTRGLQIGHRHLLPIYPFLALLGAALFARIWERRRLSLRAGVVAAIWVALPVASAVEIARIHPHELSYFNPLAGGPVAGAHILSDSNIDWGLDLRRLAAELRRRGVTDETVSYFGGDRVDYRLGVADFSAVPVVRGRLVAISAFLLAAGPEFYAYHGAMAQAGALRSLQRRIAAAGPPVGRVGYSIYLFELPQGDNP